MARPYPSTGPFRVDQLREGDRYELDDGNPVYCAPSGGHHGKAAARGGRALGADPDVEEIGFDVGYAAGSRDLRAPDISVGNVPDAHGWATGAPRLAVEYAGRGQNEEELQAKIEELIERGTELVWVARLIGPRRVEVYAPERPMTVHRSGERLEAPGILRNPVAVDALFDESASLEAALEGLLQREGYASLDAVRDEGRRASLRRLLERRFGPLDADTERRLEAADLEALETALDRVLDAPSVEDVI